ncbi:glycosyltransferase family 4 protein [Vibrio sp. 10N.261.51.C6]|uniref:glycosyltransferase family 4 protein n=1 Tax=Vibrio sp. 10N.261.51.C6 TaxID=3229676 RepID=UPI003553D7CA
MRLAYLVSDFSIDLDKPGGPSSHIKGSVQGFQSHGYEVKVFLAGDYKLMEPSQSVSKSTNQVKKGANKAKGVRLLISELRRRWNLRKLPETLVSELKAFEPDVIYERSSIFSDAGVRLAQELKCFHLLETSGCESEIFEETYGLFSIRFSNWLEGRKLNLAHAVITQSSASVIPVVNKFKLKVPAIAKPIGQDIPIRNQLSKEIVPKQVFELRKRYSCLVVFVGTFASYQGPEFLMKIIGSAQIKYPEIGFILCGEGGNQLECFEYSKTNNLSNVLFTGMLGSDSLNATLNICDIAIVPDCERNLSPIKVLQYGANKLPVIVPNYPAFDELIVQGKTGYRFESGNIDSVLACFGLVLDSFERVAFMGQKFQDVIRNRYSWKMAVSDVVDAISKKS